MRGNFIEKVFQSKLINRSKVVFVGTMMSQLITFVTSFVITAYFTPEDLGLLGTLTALISIIAGTLSFRLDLAIIQADKDESATVFLQSTILSGLACTLFCLACFFLPWSFAQKITSFFFPFVVWCWGYNFFFNSKQLPFRYDELRISSAAVIYKSLFVLIFQLLGGWINPTFSWLISGRIIGDFVGGFVHIKSYFRSINLRNATSGWLKFLKKHSDNILYVTPHHLCLALSNNIIIFFLERSYGLATVGFFALGQRLIQAPLEMVGSTLFNVTIQRFSELKDHPSDLRHFYLKIVVFSLFISSAIGIIIWGTIDFFIPVLGEKWLGAAPMVKNLIPYFMSILFVTPTTNFLRFINRSRLQLNLELFELAIKLSFLFLIRFSSSESMVLNYSLLAFGLSFLKTTIVFRLIK
ncbi:MAG: oligosaccharide flippase family protein [Bacteriovoracia bacterium]